MATKAKTHLLEGLDVKMVYALFNSECLPTQRESDRASIGEVAKVRAKAKTKTHSRVPDEACLVSMAERGE
jgi:hypothetical protein